MPEKDTVWSCGHYLLFFVSYEYSDKSIIANHKCKNWNRVVWYFKRKIWVALFITPNRHYEVVIGSKICNISLEISLLKLNMDYAKPNTSFQTGCRPICVTIHNTRDYTLVGRDIAERLHSHVWQCRPQSTPQGSCWVHAFTTLFICIWMPTLLAYILRFPQIKLISTDFLLRLLHH